jgi:hypothetical protein
MQCHSTCIWFVLLLGLVQTAALDKQHGFKLSPENVCHAAVLHKYPQPQPTKSTFFFLSPDHSKALI